MAFHRMLGEVHLPNLHATTTTTRAGVDGRNPPTRDTGVVVGMAAQSDMGEAGLVGS